MSKNITLVGFMGTGKTTIALLLAKRLGMGYVSLDDLIEKREGKKIADIFNEKGEPYFRELEQEIAKEVSSRINSVIDAGGGVVLREENLNNLRRQGMIVCLSASTEAILERTKGKAHRPLLNTEDPRRKIEELLALRAPFYAKADYTIDTTGLGVNEAVEKVIGIFKAQR